MKGVRIVFDSSPNQCLTTFRAEAHICNELYVAEKMNGSLPNALFHA